MSSDRDLVAALAAAGVLDGIRWAYSSAVGRTLEDFSEPAGYDAAWMGQTRHTLFRDRLDRVFSCGKYALQAGVDNESGIDLVYAELTQRDIATKPVVPAGNVRRADLSGSPGWAHDTVRFLLASCDFERIDAMPWPQKSATKQRVADQPTPDPLPTLFDEMAAGEVGGPLALAAGSLDLETLVVAHTLDTYSQPRELVLGRARLNRGGGPAWHWYENLLTTPSSDGRSIVDRSMPSQPDPVHDVAVKLRRGPSDAGQDRAQ